MSPRSVRNDFEIKIESSDGTAIIHVRGELDLTSAETLIESGRRALAEHAATVALDLREVEFMDSTGLRALLAVRDQADGAGRRFVVVRGNRQIQRLLDLTKVSDHITAVDDPSELG